MRGRGHASKQGWTVDCGWAAGQVDWAVCRQPWLVGARLPQPAQPPWRAPPTRHIQVHQLRQPQQLLGQARAKRLLGRGVGRGRGQHAQPRQAERQAALCQVRAVVWVPPGWRGGGLNYQAGRQGSPQRAACRMQVSCCRPDRCATAPAGSSTPAGHPPTTVDSSRCASRDSAPSWLPSVSIGALRGAGGRQGSAGGFWLALYCWRMHGPQQHQRYAQGGAAARAGRGT